ncbi:MAG: THUMP-like domain-containing protein [Segniliparus sp.]|uniref:THUMP-like domain-containing protein n=1 Tax=Segniliparus sp. TaxID=2804064 RepID=UPI003F3336AC
MAYQFTLDDVAYLSSAEGHVALAEVAGRELSKASLLGDVAAARARFGGWAAALVETALLRRRAREKLADAEHWLFTDEALQQATPTQVARHRAARLAGRAVHDVTCSIGAELRELAGTCAPALGSDLDPVRLAIARHNLADQARTGIVRADALAPASRDCVLVADPARRSAAGRTVDPEAFQPALPALFEACAGRDLVVKCAPGLDFAKLRALGFAGEIEVVSLAGSAREAALWSPGLATAARRASVLGKDGLVEQITDEEPDDCAAAPAGEWIVDPDPAIVRSGLVRHYAHRHGLWQLDPHIAYLTGDAPPPGTRGFRVLEQLPYSEKKLRAALQARQVGAVEILTRGVDVEPDALRPRLKLRGSERLAVVIARIGAHPSAFLCQPAW